jgi:hypothetical protein
VKHSNWLSWRDAALSVLAMTIIAVIGIAASQAGQYEQPPSFSASQVVPSNLLKSPYYTVDNRVGLDNYQYVFTVNTRWGTFRIDGTTLLRVRAREMEATAKLAEIDTAGTVVDAAGRTALKPLGTAKGLLTAPGKTISDTFKGVGNLFGGMQAAMEATDPRKEGIIASVSGGADARRKIAFDLGVDPYTSFTPLDDELTRLATANAIGGTSVNVGLGFVTGGVGIAISATSTSQKLREALRDKTAAQLEQTGREFLAAMGVTGAPVNALYANAYLTPTDKAVIVVALKTLGNVSVSGREIYVETAAQAKSVEMAFHYRRQSELIVKYNDKVAPVRGFIRAGRAPMIETGRGTVSILPVDYLYWSAPLESLAAGGRGEMWITGRASVRATAQLVAQDGRAQGRCQTRGVSPTIRLLSGVNIGARLLPARRLAGRSLPLRLSAPPGCAQRLEPDPGEVDHNRDQRGAATDDQHRPSLANASSTFLDFPGPILFRPQCRSPAVPCGIAAPRTRL